MIDNQKESWWQRYLYRVEMEAEEKGLPQFLANEVANLVYQLNYKIVPEEEVCDRVTVLTDTYGLTAVHRTLLIAHSVFVLYHEQCPKEAKPESWADCQV